MPWKTLVLGMVTVMPLGWVRTVCLRVSCLAVPVIPETSMVSPRRKGLLTPRMIPEMRFWTMSWSAKPMAKPATPAPARMETRALSRPRMESAMTRPKAMRAILMKNPMSWAIVLESNRLEKYFSKVALAILPRYLKKRRIRRATTRLGSISIEMSHQEVTLSIMIL